MGQQHIVSSVGSREESISLSFPTSRGWIACIPWLMAPSLYCHHISIWPSCFPLRRTPFPNNFSFSRCFEMQFYLILNSHIYLSLWPDFILIQYQDYRVLITIVLYFAIWRPNSQLFLLFEKFLAVFADFLFQDFTGQVLQNTMLLSVEIVLNLWVTS